MCKRDGKSRKGHVEDTLIFISNCNNFSGSHLHYYKKSSFSLIKNKLKT